MSAPFIVWQETGEGDSFSSDNKKSEQVITGTVDLYSKTEFDPLIDQIQDALRGVDNLGWQLADAVYEDETGLIHHSWEFSIA